MLDAHFAMVFSWRPCRNGSRRGGPFGPPPPTSTPFRPGHGWWTSVGSPALWPCTGPHRSREFQVDRLLRRPSRRQPEMQNAAITSHSMWMPESSHSLRFLPSDAEVQPHLDVPFSPFSIALCDVAPPRGSFNFGVTPWSVAAHDLEAQRRACTLPTEVVTSRGIFAAVGSECSGCGGALHGAT